MSEPTDEPRWDPFKAYRDRRNPPATETTDTEEPCSE